MNVRDLPIVGWVRRAGADDPMFDLLLVLGPILVLVLTVLGRSMLSVSIGVLYLLAFVGVILYKWTR